MSIRFIHDIDDLADDLTHIAKTAKKDMAKVVRSNIHDGHIVAHRLARSASGPHGKAYFRRITAEMTGATTGEYGPTGDVAGNAVGAGWRNGAGNRDLPQSLDRQAPKFRADVHDLPGRWFWR